MKRPLLTRTIRNFGFLSRSVPRQRVQPANKDEGSSDSLKIIFTAFHLVFLSLPGRLPNQGPLALGMGELKGVEGLKSPSIRIKGVAWLKVAHLNSCLFFLTHLATGGSCRFCSGRSPLFSLGLLPRNYFFSAHFPFFTSETPAPRRCLCSSCLLPPFCFFSSFKVP